MFKILAPYLTDMKGNEKILHEHFMKKFLNGTQVETILELGVYQLQGGQADLPGQSTKIFFMLHNRFPIKKMISVDIDNCKQTIDRCVKFFKNRNLFVPRHEFVQSDSLQFPVTKYFENGIDLLLIDSSHDDDYPMRRGHADTTGGAGTTYKELVYYEPYISDNGSIFLHDTKEFYVEKEYGHNVAGAIEKFLDVFSGWEYIEHETNKHGLGELRRINE